MSEFLKDLNQLDTAQQLHLLINYLAVLQDGRAKPDTKGNGGWIRECVYNIDEIEEVKKRINQIMGIHIPAKPYQIQDMQTKKTYLYNK
jgi:hypothetical protein